jgi:hypothetical protein
MRKRLDELTSLLLVQIVDAHAVGGQGDLPDGLGRQPHCLRFPENRPDLGLSSGVVFRVLNLLGLDGDDWLRCWLLMEPQRWVWGWVFSKYANGRR